MRYIKSTFLILIIMMPVLFLTGCKSNDESDGDKAFEIYYINKSGTSLQAVEYEIGSGELMDQVKEVLDAICIGRSQCVTPVPPDVDIISYSYANEVLSLNFDAAYKNMDSVAEIFLRASMVLTMTQLEGVNYVNFYINDQPLKDNQGHTVGIMKASNFIDKVGNTINNYEATTVTLYFANVKGNSLRTEIRTGMYDSSKSLERYIVEQIIAGPASDGNYRTIPDSTSVLSVNTNDGICYIDFDNSFLQGASSVKDEIMLYSIVNSLTELSYINKVQISVDGEVDAMLHNRLPLNILYLRDLSYMEQ